MADTQIRVMILMSCLSHLASGCFSFSTCIHIFCISFHAFCRITSSSPCIFTPQFWISCDSSTPLLIALPVNLAIIFLHYRASLLHFLHTPCLLPSCLPYICTHLLRGGSGFCLRNENVALVRVTCGIAAPSWTSRRMVTLTAPARCV